MYSHEPQISPVGEADWLVPRPMDIYGIFDSLVGKMVPPIMWL
ncbi:MAG: hypothetical protein ACTSXS_12070 [Candidatus Thorarchaeota archaeon]